MKTYRQAVQPDEDDIVEMQEEISAQSQPRMRLRAILDMMIIGLMIAIILTLSLPVCMAVVEQSEQTRRREAALRNRPESLRSSHVPKADPDANASASL
jgi:hypothetical protein